MLWRAAEPPGKPVKEKIDNRSCVKRQHLAYDQSADNRDSERPSKFRADTCAPGKRQPAEQGGHSGHHDGTEAQEASLVDSFDRRLTVIALGFKRKVDHHDGVLFDNADEQDDAYKSDNVE